MDVERNGLSGRQCWGSSGVKVDGSTDLATEVVSHTGPLSIVFERDWKTYPWEKSNECRLKRDHFKRKMLSPTIMFQGICWFWGEYSFTAYCVMFTFFLQYFCFVLHFHMYQLPILK